MQCASSITMRWSFVPRSDSSFKPEPWKSFFGCMYTSANSPLAARPSIDLSSWPPPRNVATVPPGPLLSATTWSSISALSGEMTIVALGDDDWNARSAGSWKHMDLPKPVLATIMASLRSSSARTIGSWCGRNSKRP
eukprot:3556230-Prymnesium_polylepis.1